MVVKWTTNDDEKDRDVAKQKKTVEGTHKSFLTLRRTLVSNRSCKSSNNKEQ